MGVVVTGASPYAESLAARRVANGLSAKGLLKDRPKTCSTLLVRTVFFDRDGVLNEAIVIDGKPFSPRHLGDFKLLPEAEPILWKLKAAGFFIAVITNQPDVGRGLMSQTEIEAMHRHLAAALPVDVIAACYDDGKMLNSEYRKPNPGMILHLAERYGLDLPKSFVVGDRWSDIEAGRRAGCQTVFLDRHYAERLESPPHHEVQELAEIIPLTMGH